jgi:ribosomal protein S18 acetylase RimI-like enzyme
MLEKSLYDTNPDVLRSLQNLIKTATRTEKSQVVDVITLAFSTDPAARWMYPNSQQFLQSFPNFVRMFGGKAFETGSAYYIEGFSAASLWLPPNVAPNEDALVSLFKNSVDCKIQDELFYIFEQMGNFHPKEPHWYLPLIGADPVQQGRGYGSILMKYALKRCDRDNLPAYLESSNARNISLYERFGFRLLGKIQVGSSPPVFPMRREPENKVSAYDAESIQNN